MTVEKATRGISTALEDKKTWSLVDIRHASSPMFLPDLCIYLYGDNLAVPNEEALTSSYFSEGGVHRSPPSPLRL